MTTKTRILAIGPGKKWEDYLPYPSEKYEIVCVDQSYSLYNSGNEHVRLIKMNIFDYFESDMINENFHMIHADRVFEHIPYEKIPYLLYSCKEHLKEDCEIIFTVPDFIKIFDKINNINPYSPAINFNRQMIDVHTELFNEPSDPHRSIWTEKLIKYYIELEDFWTDLKIEKFKMDNRSWYLRVTAKKK